MTSPGCLILHDSALNNRPPTADNTRHKSLCDLKTPEPKTTHLLIFNRHQDRQCSGRQEHCFGYALGPPHAAPDVCNLAQVPAPISTMTVR
jgi:hypothetical protein